MNVSLRLFAAAVCCLLHLGPASCRKLETISEEQLHRGLLQLKEGVYNGLLLYSVPAAGSGKSLFQTSRSLSEDCVRTAKAAMQSLEKLSTLDPTAVAVRESVHEAAKRKTNDTYHDQVELVCQILNAKMKAVAVDFDESKAAVQLPRPAKNYILRIPAGQKVEEWVLTTPMPFDDAELIKFQIILTLVKFRTLVTDEKQYELVAAAKAIEQMARRSAFKYTMDRVFKSAFDDFVKNLLAQGVDKLNEENVESHGAAFIKKVDRQFLNNVLLKEEYSKTKTEVAKSTFSKS